jgi:PAS domain S-box-containing protein
VNPIYLLTTDCILQFIAFLLSLRIIIITRKINYWAWFLLGILLMLTRRVFYLYQFSENTNQTPLPLDQYLSAGISFFIMIGIWKITPNQLALVKSERTLAISESELNKSKDYLQRVNERYTLATEAAGVGVWDWDIENSIYQWNEQMFQLWELSKSDSMDENRKLLTNKIIPEDNEKNKEELALALEGKKDYNVLLRLYLKDGTIRYTQAIGKVFRDNTNKPIRMIGVNIDITQLKTKEESIKKSEQKWKSLVESIPDYISIYDTDGSYLFLNHFAEGYSEKDILGKKYYDFLPEEAQRIMQSAFQRVLKTKKYNS